MRSFNSQCYLTRHVNQRHKDETVTTVSCQRCSFTGTQAGVLLHGQQSCPSAPRRTPPQPPTSVLPPPSITPQLFSSPPSFTTHPETPLPQSVPPRTPSECADHPGNRLWCELVAKHHHDGLYRLVLSFTSPGVVLDPDNFYTHEPLLHVLSVVELATTNNVSHVAVERVVKLFKALSDGQAPATQRLPSTWRTLHSYASSGYDTRNLVPHQLPVPPHLDVGTESVPYVQKPFRAVVEEVLYDPSTVECDNFFFEVPHPVPEGECV